MLSFKSVRRVLGGLCLLICANAAAQPGPIIFVDADAGGQNNGENWTDAFNDLQDALETAQPGDEVWVAEGVYKPDRQTGERSRSFLLADDVGVFGGFRGDETQREQRDPAANVTVLSGDLKNDDQPEFTNRDDNSFRVIVAELPDAEAKLDGFTVRGGQAEGGLGGGILVDGQLSVSNCSFTDNLAHRGGGAFVASGSVRFENCTFDRNVAVNEGGGLSGNRGSLVTIERCVFKENIAETAGGGAKTVSAWIVVDCVFERNRAKRSSSGGLFAGLRSTVINSRFVGNRAKSGGGGASAVGANFINCLFAGNSATSGGGLSVSLSFVYNCTFAANSATGGAGGLRDSDKSIIHNCVLWDNDVNGVRDEDAQIESEFWNFTYSSVQGWTGKWGGEGNRDADPLFFDPDGIDNILGTADDDFRLGAGSQCIDAADNARVPRDELDLDNDGDTEEPLPFGLYGRARFVDDPDSEDTGKGEPPIVDMGVAEFRKFPFVIEGDPVSVPEGADAVFTVALAEDPGEPLEVTIAFDSGDVDISIKSGARLQFNSGNFDVPQPVTLTAAEDEDFVDGSTAFAVAANGFVSIGVTAVEVDNDSVQPVVFVDADAAGDNTGVDWQNAFNDLQDALDLAREFPAVGEIWVAEGVYKPDRGTQDYKLSFELVDGVALFGGFNGTETRREQRNWRFLVTELSGFIGGNNGGLSMNVVTSQGVGATTVLDGFRVKTGRRGMRNIGGNPTIRNCRFADHKANESGGGMLNDGANPLIINCTFKANRDSAAQKGIGMYNINASPVLIKCAFLSNRFGIGSGDGGGMANVNGSAPLVIDTIFRENQAENGGGVYNQDSSPIFIGCTFRRNDAESGFTGSGGGMFNQTSDPTLINCVFGDNLSKQDAGGVSNSPDSSPRLVNCVLWDNIVGGDRETGKINEHTQITGGTPTVSYCCIRGWTRGGVGNISDPPQFIDLKAGDYHYFDDSPCIDAGDPAFAPRPGQTDVDGQKRVWNDRVDMGIDEFGSFVFADMNCDGSIDLIDVESFVLALIDPAEYGTQHPDCDIDLGDTNTDGSVDLQDVETFIELLIEP